MRIAAGPLHHGDTVTFTCWVILDPSVDTITTLSVDFSGTDGTDITNTTTAMVFSGAQTFSYSATPSAAGTFMFTCTATASDATSSMFIDDNSQESDTTDIVIGMYVDIEFRVKLISYVLAPTDLAVSILPVYTAPADAILEPNQYRAASQLTLSCQASGNTGEISYHWSSTSTDCAVSSTVIGQNVVVSNRSEVSDFNNYLRSDDAGTYTCEATDSANNFGRASTDVNIVGKM